MNISVFLLPDLHKALFLDRNIAKQMSFIICFTGLAVVNWRFGEEILLSDPIAIIDTIVAYYLIGILIAFGIAELRKGGIHILPELPENSVDAEVATGRD